MSSPKDLRYPRLCPDHDCTPLYWCMGEDNYFDRGGSFDCYGKRKEPFEYKYKETVHTNDLNHCIFCPGGIYVFKESLGDLQRTMMAVSHLLTILDPNFDWQECRSYYSGHDPAVIELIEFFYCESKTCPEGGGPVTCKHTKKACQAFNCPVWIMSKVDKTK